MTKSRCPTTQRGSRLVIGLLAWGFGRSEIAWWAWAAGTAPVVAGLLISMIRDFLAGRMGVDAVAFVSMSSALALGETLAINGGGHVGIVQPATAEHVE